MTVSELQLRIAKRLFALNPEDKTTWDGASEEVRKRHLAEAWETLDEVRIPTEAMIEAGCGVNQIAPVGPRVIAIFSAMMTAAAR